MTRAQDKRISDPREKPDLLCEVIAALMKGPRTVADLVEVTGFAESPVRIAVERLHASGLLYQAGIRKWLGRAGYGAAVWAWQCDGPYARCDSFGMID